MDTGLVYYVDLVEIVAALCVAWSGLSGLGSFSLFIIVSHVFVFVRSMSQHCVGKYRYTSQEDDRPVTAEPEEGAVNRVLVTARSRRP